MQHELNATAQSKGLPQATEVTRAYPSVARPPRWSPARQPEEPKRTCPTSLAPLGTLQRKQAAETGRHSTRKHRLRAGSARLGSAARPQTSTAVGSHQLYVSRD